MKVSELMTPRVESIASATNLRAAARKVKELGVGALPVVEDGKVLGIITDRDLARASHELASQVLEATIPVH